jgi:hypothetical protein
VSIGSALNRSSCAAAGHRKPKYLSTDHDPLFRFHRWLANLRVIEVEEIKSVPYAPVSHPLVERLIGTIRREYLDRVFFWNAVDLARKLNEYKDYYNAHRVHRSLGGTTPAQCAGASSLPAKAGAGRLLCPGQRASTGDQSGNTEVHGCRRRGLYSRAGPCRLREGRRCLFSAAGSDLFAKDWACLAQK